jgi:hypothetical protein
MAARGGEGLARIRPVGGWVQGNGRNWIIHRRIKEKEGFKKKSVAEDSKENTKIGVEANYFFQKTFAQKKNMNL